MDKNRNTLIMAYIYILLPSSNAVALVLIKSLYISHILPCKPYCSHFHSLPCSWRCDQWCEWQMYYSWIELCDLWCQWIKCCNKLIKGVVTGSWARLDWRGKARASNCSWSFNEDMGVELPSSIKDDGAPQSMMPCFWWNVVFEFSFSIQFYWQII